MSASSLRPGKTKLPPPPAGGGGNSLHYAPHCKSAPKIWNLSSGMLRGVDSLSSTFRQNVTAPFWRAKICFWTAWPWWYDY
jgi:hypothetical protein